MFTVGKSHVTFYIFRKISVMPEQTSVLLMLHNFDLLVNWGRDAYVGPVHPVPPRSRNLGSEHSQGLHGNGLHYLPMVIYLCRFTDPN